MIQRITCLFEENCHITPISKHYLVESSKCSEIFGMVFTAKRGKGSNFIVETCSRSGNATM